jgi:hypothetical protein
MKLTSIKPIEHRLLKNLEVYEEMQRHPMNCCRTMHYNLYLYGPDRFKDDERCPWCQKKIAR